MVDQHGRQRRAACAASRRSVSATRASAPGLPVGYGSGCSRISSVQTTPGVVRAAPAPPPSSPSPGSRKRVVVEQEQRRDGDRAAGAAPDRVRVLGRDHAQARGTSRPGAGSAPRRAAGPGRWDGSTARGCRAPRSPSRTARASSAAAPIRCPTTFSATSPATISQSSSEAGPQLLDDAPVLLVADVQVADGQQRRHAWPTPREPAHPRARPVSGEPVAAADRPPCAGTGGAPHVSSFTNTAASVPPASRARSRICDRPAKEPSHDRSRTRIPPCRAASRRLSDNPFLFLVECVYLVSFVAQSGG